MNFIPDQQVIDTFTAPQASAVEPKIFKGWTLLKYGNGLEPPSLFYLCMFEFQAWTFGSDAYVAVLFEREDYLPACMIYATSARKIIDKDGLVTYLDQKTIVQKPKTKSSITCPNGWVDVTNQEAFHAGVMIVSYDIHSTRKDQITAVINTLGSILNKQVTWRFLDDEGATTVLLKMEPVGASPTNHFNWNFKPIAMYVGNVGDYYKYIASLSNT